MNLNIQYPPSDFPNSGAAGRSRRRIARQAPNSPHARLDKVISPSLSLIEATTAFLVDSSQSADGSRRASGASSRISSSFAERFVKIFAWIEDTACQWHARQESECAWVRGYGCRWLPRPRQTVSPHFESQRRLLMPCPSAVSCTRARDLLTEPGGVLLASTKPQKTTAGLFPTVNTCDTCLALLAEEHPATRLWPPSRPQ